MSFSLSFSLSRTHLQLHLCKTSLLGKKINVTGIRTFAHSFGFRKLSSSIVVCFCMSEEILNCYFSVFTISGRYKLPIRYELIRLNPTFLSLANGQRPRNYSSCCCCCCSFLFVSFHRSEKILLHRESKRGPLAPQPSTLINWASAPLSR